VRRLSFNVIEGGRQEEPKREILSPAHGLEIVAVGVSIFWLGVGAAVLAWWERP
jgi:hypothetical protein